MESPRVTKIELLIVGAIVLIVLFTSVILVMSARSKTRDVTRLAHVRLVQSALEDYFNENNRYPDGSALPLGDVTQSNCLSMSGFQADCSGDPQQFLRLVPSAFEKGLDGLVLCGTPERNAFCYTTDPAGQKYQILFELENTMNALRLNKGIACATQAGINSGECK